MSTIEFTCVLPDGIHINHAIGVEYDGLKSGLLQLPEVSSIVEGSPVESERGTAIIVPTSSDKTNFILRCLANIGVCIPVHA